MKKMLMLLLLCIFYLSNAQQIKFSSDDFPGIEKRMINTNDYYLPLNENEFLFAGGKGNSDDVSLIKLDKNCKALWSIPKIEGYLSAAKFNNNIVVFSAKNSNKYGFRFINFIHATLINNETGKIISEKDIPSYTNKAITDIYILTDSSKNFQYLVLRSTEQEKIMMVSAFKSEQDFGYTDNLQAISFDKDFNVINNTLDIAEIQKAQFIACTCNDNGDIFFASIQNNVININRYNAVSSKISTNVNAKTNFENDVAVWQGEIKLHQNNLWLACKFDESKTTPLSLVTGIFNLNDKQGRIQQDLMDKDYLKQYAEKTSSVNIIGTEFYKDKFIVIKEFNTSNHTVSQTNYTVYGPIIISVYSSAMKLLKELEINEKFSVFYNLNCAGYKLLNNQLFVFSNKTKLSGAKTNYQIINLDNFSLSDENEIKIDSKLNMILYSPGIVWFKNSALLPYAEQNNMFNPNKIFTNFKSVDF